MVNYVVHLDLAIKLILSLLLFIRLWFRNSGYILAQFVRSAKVSNAYFRIAAILILIYTYFGISHANFSKSMAYANFSSAPNKLNFYVPRLL